MRENLFIVILNLGEQDLPDLKIYIGKNARYVESGYPKLVDGMITSMEVENKKLCVKIDPKDKAFASMRCVTYGKMTIAQLDDKVVLTANPFQNLVIFYEKE